MGPAEGTGVAIGWGFATLTIFRLDFSAPAPVVAFGDVFSVSALKHVVFHCTLDVFATAVWIVFADVAYEMLEIIEDIVALNEIRDGLSACFHSLGSNVHDDEGAPTWLGLGAAARHALLQRRVDCVAPSRNDRHHARRHSEI